ncbi:MAG TPA: glycosyltransferase family 39 protein [Candidatus Limnocylindria bacterium]|nr:glycosyltransferase family 39 protein [Candidatus Limnocylindria bacterium]
MSSRARISPWLLCAVVFAAAYWMFDLAGLRAGVPAPLDDTWEDGIIARLLWRGEWLRSHMLYPPLWGLIDPATWTIPVLVHGPLLPLLLAVPLQVLGDPALDHVAWLAAAFALLTSVVLFRLAARHFGDAVGAAAAGLFTVSPVVLEAVHHSLSVVLGAFLVTSVLNLVARERPRGALAGACAGLAYLVRPEMLVALPVVLLLMRSTRSGERRRFLIVFLLCGSWWWWHHARAIGHPLFNLTSYTLIGYWGDRPEASVMRDFALTPDRWPAELARQLPNLWRKWLEFFPHAAKKALEIPTGTTGWMAVIGLVTCLRDANTRRLAACALALGAIPIAAMTLTVYQRLYLVPFAPLWALGAALGARALFARLPDWAHRPRAWIGALALAALPSTGPALATATAQARLLERWIAQDRAQLAALAARGDSPRPMFSDTPDFVAWTTGRPTFWVTRAEFVRLYPNVPTPVAGATTTDSDSTRFVRSGDSVPGGRSPSPSRRPARLPGHPGPGDLWFHVDPRDPAANLDPP